MDTPSSSISGSSLVDRILVTTQHDMTTTRTSTRSEDKTDASIKNPYDPAVYVATLMIRGCDLQILEGDLSVFNNPKGIGVIEQVAIPVLELYLC
jgi:hypothetical protein